MPLEHVFDEMEISAEPFALCELHGRCTLALESLPGATLHYVLAGHGEVAWRGRAPVAVKTGTLLLVPAAQPHILRGFGGHDRSLPECHQEELGLAALLAQEDGAGEGGGGMLVALCGRVTIGIRGARGLVDLVREPIVEVVNARDAIGGSVARLLRELALPGPGNRAMVRALLLECMIHLLRGRLQAGDPALDWMNVLADERLWLVLGRMLEAPGEPHTIESLATVAGMSRSVFAARFAAACGLGPMEFLRELRMHRATWLLRQSDLPVKRVAEMVGFRSRSAFSRMFSRMTGMSPQGCRSSSAQDHASWAR
jgi:AraC-like DNA-binding protein